MFGSLHCQKKKKLALSRVLCDLYHGCAYMLQIKDKSSIQLVDCSQAAFFFVVASPGYRAVGIVVIRTMEIVSGDVTMKLDNDFFSQSKRSSATSPSTKKPHKEYQLSALAKYSMYFSEKVRMLSKKWVS